MIRATETGGISPWNLNWGEGRTTFERKGEGTSCFPFLQKKKNCEEVHRGDPTGVSHGGFLHLFRPT